MRKTLHKYFIPHHTNEYRPHFLRKKSIHFLVFLIVVVFSSSYTMKSIADSSGLAPIILPDILVQLTNQDRATNNIQTLSVNQKLVDAATYKVIDMSSKEYFAHTSPEGVTPWYWFKKAGYTFIHAGENLAINFSSSHDVEAAWMNSPGHRANILSANYKEIGIATINANFKGRPTIFVVQLFGSPGQIAPQKIQTINTSLTKETKKTVSLKTEEVNMADTQTVLGLNETVEVIADTPVSLEFKAVDEQIVPSEVDAPVVPARVSWLERFFLNPSQLMQQIYLALAALVFLALLLHIFIKIEHQHIPSIASGVFVLFLMAGLYIFFVKVFGASFVFL